MKAEIGLTTMFGRICLVIKPEDKESAEILVITEEQKDKLLSMGVDAAEVIVR